MAGDIPGLPDKAASWFDKAFRPLHDFYLWCQTVDDRIRAGADTASSDLDAAIAALRVKDQWTHTIPEVENVSLRFLCVAETDGTIDTTRTDCASGTCTVRWFINGVAVGTVTNSVSTTAQTRTHSAANTFVAGDVITYTITSNATCLEAVLQANVTRKLV